MLIFLCSSLLYALSPTEIKSWIDSNGRASNANAILKEYGGLSDAFIDTLGHWTQEQLTKSASSALQNYQRGDCEEGAFFKIINGRNLSANLSDTEMQFSNSLFLIESSYCLTDTNVQEAFQVYMSPEFRINVMPRVVEMTPKANGFCIHCDGIPGLLLPTQQCSRTRILQEGNAILIHNSLQSRSTGSDFQPLFYREEIFLFVSIPDGVALYRGTFTRSVELGVTTKYILRNTVESSQESIRNQYQEWLQR